MNRFSRMGLCAVLLLFAVTAAACGGSSAAKAPPTTSGSNANAQAQFQAYQQCLQQQGVNPDQLRRPAGSGPRPSTPPATDPKMAAARQACRSKLPQGFGNGQRSQAMQAYISCMKDHGVTIPSDAAGLRNVDRNDPKFQAGDKTCAPLRPRFGPGGPGGPGAGSGTPTPAPAQS